MCVCGSVPYRILLLTQIWGIFLTLVIIMSLITMILETETSLREPPMDEVLANVTITTGIYEYYAIKSDPAEWISWIILLSLIILTAEYVVRFIVSYKKCIFLLNPLNIFDLLGILPMWILYAVYRYKAEFDAEFSNTVEKAISMLAIFRLFRIFRFIRLMTYSKQLKIIYIAIMISWREIIILATLMAMLSITFGSAIYYAEMKRDTVDSILTGQWWAIITMTTVGYGDIYPATHVGRAIGVLCSLTGIVHIALATTVIVNNFLISTDGVHTYVTSKRRETNDVKAIKIWDTQAEEPLLDSNQETMTKDNQHTV